MEPSNTPHPSDFPENGPDNGRERRSGAEAWINDLEATLSDSTQQDIDALKLRLREQLALTRESLHDAGETAQDLLRETVDCTESYIHARPWQAVGLFSAAAFLLGVIVGRQR